MIDFMRLPWKAVVLTAFALGACGGSSDDEPPQAGPPVPITLQPVFTGLPAFSSPIAMLQAPGDSTRWFVVEQAGRILAFDNLPNVSTTASFLDIRGSIVAGGETGLLGMAFHPDFPNDPRVYLYYTDNDTTLGLVARLSEFSLATTGNTLDPLSEAILLTVEQPESNHNGGGIAFGPDGFLYAGLGDGGGANDQHPPDGTGTGNGQRQTILLGKMLRIDVENPTGGFLYGIPPDNPNVTSTVFCGTNGTGPQNCPEIFAIGLRNPWRWSFDRQNGQLWAGDVGQGALEEIDRITRGGNYGWRCLEGTNNTGLACGPLPAPVAPIAQYGRGVGASVTGGYVYRGTAIPALIGRYVFGDFISGRIFNIPGGTQPTVTVSAGLDSGLNISSFGEGIDGELYVVNYSGSLHRISP